MCLDISIYGIQLSCFFFLGIEIYVQDMGWWMYIWISCEYLCTFICWNAGMLFEQPVLFFLEYFCTLLVWEASVEYFGQHILEGWLYGQPLLEYFGYQQLQCARWCWHALSICPKNLPPKKWQTTNCTQWHASPLNLVWKFNWNHVHARCSSDLIILAGGASNLTWVSFKFCSHYLKCDPENLICGLLPFKRQSFDQGQHQLHRTLICAQWSKSAFKSK